MQSLPTKLFIIGLICLFGTIAIFWVIIPGGLHFVVSQMMRFEEGNEIYNAFTDIEAEILFNVYIYNITNSEEVESGAQKPTFQELGPYIYEEQRKNIPVKMDTETGTFTYQTIIYFHFRPDLSNCSDEDVIMSLNVPIVAVANELNKWSSMVRYMAKYYINSFKEPLFVQRKVKTLLFEGTHLELIESVSSLIGMDYLLNNTFAYFYDKNATLSKPFEIDTGVENSENFGKIKTWGGKDKMDVWKGDTCNMINGSDTSIYPPFMTKDSILRGFEADICRSVYMVFKKEDEYEGVKGYRFGLPEDFFVTNSSYNECFCFEEDRADCPRDGAISISACKFGAPLLMSHPHFLYADPYYNELTGISKGIPELHESWGLFEPRLGAVLKAKRRMQINIQMKKSKDIPELKNVQDTIVPLIWIDEDARQPESRMKDLRTRLVLPLTLAEIGKWVMLALSSVLTVVGLLIFLLRTKNKKPVQYY